MVRDAKDNGQCPADWETARTGDRSALQTTGMQFPMRLNRWIQPGSWHRGAHTSLGTEVDEALIPLCVYRAVVAARVGPASEVPLIEV